MLFSWLRFIFVISCVCVCVFTVAQDGWRYICLRHLIASVSLFALVLFLSSDLLPSVITAKSLILTHILQSLVLPISHTVLLKDVWKSF